METIEKIRELLGKYNIKQDNVTPDVDIQTLGIAGEELFDFFKIFGNFYDIDLTGINEYIFFSENPLQVLGNWISKTFSSNKEHKKPVTIAHLIKVAEHKQWFNPE